MPTVNSATDQELRFSLSASVEVGTNGENAKTSPIKIIANSGDPVNYPKIGKLAFDFSSMTHKAKIPLDWDHENETIGFLNNIDKSNGVLSASGAIVPGEGQFAERAKDLITKMQAGVPYEASIESHGGRLEEIAEGKSASVNGRTLSGPVKILRDWSLAAVAICKFGKDSATTAELRLAASKQNIQNGDDMSVTDEQIGVLRELMGSEAPQDLSKDNAMTNAITFARKSRGMALSRSKPTDRELMYAGQALREVSEKKIASGVKKATVDAVLKEFTSPEFKADSLKMGRAVTEEDTNLILGIDTAIKVLNLLEPTQRIAGLTLATDVQDSLLGDGATDPAIDGGEKDTLMLALSRRNPVKK